MVILSIYKLNIYHTVNLMYRVKNNTIPEVYHTKLQNNGGTRQSENNFEESNLLNSYRFGIF